MNDYPHHESLRLQNFTAFADASFDFVPCINVFVGENGTGKTHAMKAMYAWQRSHNTGSFRVANLEGVFQVSSVADLIRDKDGQPTVVKGEYSGMGWLFNPTADGGMGFDDIENVEPIFQPIFIPAIDMIGHTRSFVQTYDRYNIDFDLTHRDIVDALLSPSLRNSDPTHSTQFLRLDEALGGELELEGDRFYLKTAKRRLPMPSVAEGLRKVATLLRLIQVDVLTPGATLFWDEPEVNLNPVLMDEVVGALLALARSGVQIFLATHSYVILEELRDQAEVGEVRYFGFEPSPSGTVVRWTDSLPSLEPNPILDQYESLSNRKLKKAFAPRGAA